MRTNVNALLPLAAAAAFMVPGNAAASSGKVSSPEIFAACADGAVNTDGLKPAIKTEAYGGLVAPGNLPIAQATIGIDQLAPLTAPDGRGGIARCAGNTLVSMHVRLKAGSYMERPKMFASRKVYNSGAENLVNKPGWDNEVTGRFPIVKACRAALRHGRKSVSLASVQEASYQEAGHSPVKKTVSKFLARLACRKSYEDVRIIPAPERQTA